MLVLLSLVIVCCMVYYMWLWPRAGEPPLLFSTLPFIGNAHHLLGDGTDTWLLYTKKVAHCMRTQNYAVTFLIGPVKVYALLDPDDCHTIVNSCLQKEYMSYKFSKPFLGDGLIFSPIDIWSRHRKLLNPSFTSKVINGYIGVFNQQANILVEYLASQVGEQEFDVSAYIHPVAIKTICLTAMGVEMGDKKTIEQYAESVQSLMNVAMVRGKRPWLHHDFIFRWSNLKKKQDALIKKFRQMTTKVLEKKKEELRLKRQQPIDSQGSEDTKLKSFMDLLLELEEGTLTCQEIRDEVDNIMLTGSDTYVTVLNYTLVLLGSYPQVQDKVYAELMEIFQSTGREVRREDLPRLVYLEAVIKETIRCYPLGPILFRNIDKDIKLKKCTLRAGNSCMISVYALHRNHLWGDDVHHFQPERWLDTTKLPYFTKLFYGFSLGRRNCIGKVYAMVVMKIFLVHMLREYRVAADHTNMKLKMDFMLKPISGHEITLHRRLNKFSSRV